MRALICGERVWVDRNPISFVIHGLIENHGYDNVQVIHGAAKGADAVADQISREAGLKPIAFPAQWSRFGRAAGHLRNTLMLDEGRPDVVYAFFVDRSKSKGTANMVRQAKKRRIPIFAYESSRGWAVEYDPFE